jgi:hypothetical protein
MTLRPRRLSLQLTPLLDLMLIVFFLQYIELREREGLSEVAAETATAGRAATESELRKLRQDYERTRDELVVSRAEAEALAADKARLLAASGKTETDLERALARQTLLGELVVKLFHVPQPVIDRILDPGREPPVTQSPEELAQLRAQFQELASSGSGEMVKHLLTYAEVLKRADIWELHLSADPRELTLDDGTRVYRLSPRLESADRSAALDAPHFERELFELMKSLPQPKGLVLVLLTYDGGLRNNVVDPARDGVRNVLDRMRADSAGRSQFEFADLGISLP